MNIKVTYEKSSNSSLDIADGIANIELEDATGNSFNPAFSLLTKGDMTKADSELKKFTIAYGDGENNSISEIKFGDTVVPIDKVDGSLKALSENYGIKNGDKNYYTKMLSDLDKMASEFIKAFNEIHSSGYGLDGTTGRNFFTGTKASDINVSSEILQNTDAIAASLEANNKGDGQNMLKLSDVITEPISGLGTNTSVKTYYQKLIGELAVNTQEAGRNAKNTALQQANVQNDRLSVSAVSLDEEMTNLLKFQHAYNASARSMTAMDELLDKIINSMGLVGR